jgi:hypothetical protein
LIWENKPMSQIEIDPAFKSAIGMGEIKSVYKQRGFVKPWYILNSIVCIPAGFYILYYGFFTYKRLYPGNSNLAFVFLSVLLLVFGFSAAIKIIFKWGETVVLYENGFSYTQDGSDIFHVKWNEIISIKMKVVNVRVYEILPVGTQKSYTIECNTKRINLDGTLDKVDDFILFARKKTFPYIVARIKQEFNSGIPVKFGNFIISKADGVRRSLGKYKWDEIKQVNVVDGQVVFTSKKRGHIYDFVGNTPNLDILLTLSQEMIKPNS